MHDLTDESLEMTAIRELQEEFLGISCPINQIQSKMKLFNTKITLPIQGRQYCMHNYVIFDENNLWNDSQIEIINFNLQKRKENFLKLLEDESYWNLTNQQKEEISPEIYQVKWMDINEAIEIMNSAQLNTLQYVNEWQKEEFEKYSITSRDPMYQSMITLSELNELSSIEDFCNS